MCPAVWHAQDGATVFVCEYACVSVVLFLRGHMGSACLCTVALSLFLMHASLCMVRHGGLALHLHPLQRMVFASVMTESGC